MNSNSVPTPSTPQPSPVAPCARNKRKHPLLVALGPVCVMVAFFAANTDREHREEERRAPGTSTGQVKHSSPTSTNPGRGPESTEVVDTAGCGFEDT
jgi:hypothetical protein